MKICYINTPFTQKCMLNIMFIFWCPLHRHVYTANDITHTHRPTLTISISSMLWSDMWSDICAYRLLPPQLANMGQTITRYLHS